LNTTFDCNSATAIPGSGWLLGKFINDNTGELFYVSEVHAYETSPKLGIMAVGLYKYNTVTKAWQAIGGLAPRDDPKAYQFKPVLYWEESGFSPEKWFQNYQPSFKFDSANRMHFALSGNTNSAIDGANKILYGYSEDGGLTWKKANGSPIIGLPLRGVANLPASLDTVAETTLNSAYGPYTGLVVDRNNKPGVGINELWRVWDGKTWSTETPKNFTGLGSANTGYRLPNNDILFNLKNANKIVRSASFDAASIGYDFTGYANVINFDDYSLRTTGTIYSVALRSDKKTAVLKTTITPAPLPSNWQHSDIDFISTPYYQGNAGYDNGSFVLTSYGKGIGSTQDSFHYVYKKMSGDGVMTARVSLPSPYSGAGLMMRETLDNNAKEISILLSPTPDTSRALMLVRNSTAGDTFNLASANSPSTTYWLRLVRTGNVFTSYSSQDGITFTPVQSITVPMNQEIYVGLANVANANRFYMLSSTFDNVTAPIDVCVHANPSVAVTPLSQKGTAGGNVNYAIAVTNNDSATCSASNFNLNSAMPSSVKGTLDVSSLTILPGKNANATLNVASSASTPVNTYAIDINAVNAGSTLFTGKASVSYEVTSGCVLSSPVITYSPCTQNVWDLAPVYYTVTITSKDSANCPSRVFAMALNVPSNYLLGGMSPRNVVLSPGQSADSKVTIIPQAGIPAGVYDINTISHNGGIGAATLIYVSANLTTPYTPTPF
jgi:regulation of enolase protein 1 (concanavalin A-like superfamily)